jgi:hypothetical protein
VLTDQRVLRHIALGIELEADADLGWCVFPVRVEMHVHPDLGTRLDQPAGTLVEHVAVLAERVFVQECPEPGVAGSRSKLGHVSGAWALTG